MMPVFISPGIYSDPLFWCMNDSKRREVAIGFVLRALPEDGIGVVTLREVIDGLEHALEVRGVRRTFLEWCGEASFARFVYWLKTKKMVRIEGPSYYLSADVPDRLLAKVTVFPTDRRDAIIERMTPHAKAHLDAYQASLLDLLAFVSV